MLLPFIYYALCVLYVLYDKLCDFCGFVRPLCNHFSAVQGCTYILHVASPWPIVADESTIAVAKNGTMNLLEAAAKVSTVRKIVITGSCAAINGEPDFVAFLLSIIVRFGRKTFNASILDTFHPGKCVTKGGYIIQNCIRTDSNEGECIGTDSGS